MHPAVTTLAAKDDKTPALHRGGAGTDRRRRSPGEDTLRADPRHGRPRRRTSVCRASPRGAPVSAARGPALLAEALGDALAEDQARALVRARLLDAGHAAEPRHAHPAGGQRPPTPHDGFARRSTRPTHRYRTRPSPQRWTRSVRRRRKRRSHCSLEAPGGARLRRSGRPSRGLRAPHPGAARRGAHRPRGRSHTDAELAMIALRELTAEPVLPTCRSRTAALGPAGRDGFARQLNVATGTADRAWWDAFRVLANASPDLMTDLLTDHLSRVEGQRQSRRVRPWLTPLTEGLRDDFDALPPRGGRRLCAAIGTWLAEHAEQSTDAQAEDLLARMRGIERIGFEQLVDRLGPRHRTTARHRHPARGRALRTTPSWSTP